MTQLLHTQKSKLLEKYMHDVIQLRKRSLCSLAGFRGYGFNDHMQQSFERLFSSKVYIDTFELFFNFGRLEAYLIILHDPNGQESLEFDYDISSKPGETWLKDMLSKVLGQGKFVCRLLSSYHRLVKNFIQGDYAIKYLSFGGDTETALSYLNESTCRDIDTKINGDITISPLVDVCDVNAAIDLQKQVYRKQPELCWFFDNDKNTQVIAERLRISLPYQTYHNLFINGKLEGFFGYHLMGQPYLFGAEATLSICLREDFQGKGLARSLYQKIFKDMLSRNIYQFQGQTANAAVINLAEKFKRPLRYIHISPSSDCPDQARFNVYMDKR